MIGEALCDIFNKKFGTLYNSMCYEKSDMEILKDEIGDLVNQKCTKGKSYNTHVINMFMVMSAIKSLKIDKSDVNAKMPNYVIHSPQLLSDHLASLLNSFMHKC